MASEQRVAKVRQLLGLAPPEGSQTKTVAVILVVAAVAGIGAAQPVLQDTREQTARSDAQAFLVIDTSRSMLASPRSGGPTRFERARAAAMRLRDVLPNVPIGIASLTDRIVPHVFPTPNRTTIASTLRLSIGVDRPPSSDAGDVRATDFDALTALPRRNFFTGVGRRLVVVFTDAETTDFDPVELGAAYARPKTELIVVRFWRAGERVYGPGGAPEPYEPDPASAAYAAELASAVRGTAFDENELRDAITAARRALGRGETVRQVEASNVEPLAPYVFLAGLLPLGFLLYRRNLAR